MTLRIYDHKERAAIYTKLLQTYARQVGAPLAFCFVKTLMGQEHFNGRIDGAVRWQGKYFLITLRNDLPLKRELETVAHELAHVLLGHVPRVTASYAEQQTQNQQTAKIYNRQAGAGKVAALDLRESAANDRARQILREWERAGITA